MPANDVHERLAQIIGNPLRHPGPFRVALRDGTAFSGRPFYFGTSQPLTVCCVLAPDEIAASPLRYVQVDHIESITSSRSSESPSAMASEVRVEQPPDMEN